MDKKKIFDSITKMLDKNKVISGISTKENDSSYFAEFTVYGNIACCFNMRKSGNICIMKAECMTKADDEANPSVIAEDITRDDDSVRYTIYDGKIVFQRVETYEDDDKDVEEELQDSLKEFVNLFIDNAELFDCGFNDNINNTGGEVEDDSEYAVEDDTNMEEGSDDLDSMLDALQKMESYDGQVKEDDITDTKAARANTQKEKKSGDIGNTTDTINISKEKPFNSKGNGEFPEQVDQLYREFDEILDERENVLNARESHLNKFMEDLKTQEQKLEDTRKELDEEKKRIRADIEAEFNSVREELEQRKKELSIAASKVELDRRKIEAEQSTLETKKKALEENIALQTKVGGIEHYSDYKQKIDELLNQLSSFEATEKNLNNQVERMKATINTQKIVIKKFQKKRESWKQEKGDLTGQIEEMKAALAKEEKADSVTTVEHQDALKTRDNRIKELEDRIQTLSVEKDALESEKRGLKAETEKLNSKKEQLEAEKEELVKQLHKSQGDLNSGEAALADTRNLTVVAKDIIDTTKALGIHLEIVPGNGEMILAGENGDYTICVNVEVGMVYVEKTLKKTSQHIDTLEKWNGEDIRYAYYLSKSKVMCKCKYENAAKAINEIIAKLNTL